MLWTKSKRNIQEEFRERCRKRCKGVELCGNCKRYRKYVQKYGKELQPVDCVEEVAIEMIFEAQKKKKKKYEPPTIEILPSPRPTVVKTFFNLNLDKENEFNTLDVKKLFGQ